MIAAGIGFGLTGFEIFAGHFGEIVDVVQKSVRDVCGCLADVSGEGEIDEEEGEFGSEFHGFFSDF